MFEQNRNEACADAWRKYGYTDVGDWIPFDIGFMNGAEWGASWMFERFRLWLDKMGVALPVSLLAEETGVRYVSEEVLTNAQRFKRLAEIKRLYTFVDEEPTHEGTVLLSFRNPNGYVIVEVGDGFVQYYTNFGEKPNESSGRIPCDFMSMPKELERIFSC